MPNVPVQNGLFTVELDFGAVWDGSDRFLQIAVRPTPASGDPPYTTLLPRVKINPTPYAIRAGSLTLPFSGSAAVPGGTVFFVTNTATSLDPFVRSIALYGAATATSGATTGVVGRSDSVSGTGVEGVATATTGTTYGVFGASYSTHGRGVFGIAYADSGPTYGGYFLSDSTSGIGVSGWATATSGTNYGGWFRSASTLGTGVYGFATATSGAAWGVWGRTSSTTSTAYGVFCEEPAGGAGHALHASGSVSAAIKAFQIDHPLSHETHYLNHFCTEGPEPYNIYRGTVVLDAKGEAWVQLPDYFEAINRDPSYHLTAVGAPMPNLHVAVEIQGNRFKIAGGVPGKKVSWEVKAIRNDRYVQQYGYQTEQEKEDEIKGKYLHPELYGQPKERGIHYRPEPEPAPNETTKP